jgi:ABC-type phosphate transport system substrate-binding protein
MVQKKDSPVISLALLLALVTHPTLASLKPDSALAQSPSPTPVVPPNVSEDAIVVIDGSDSMQVINQSLKQRYEQQYPGKRVDLNANGTPAALKALLAGKIDLAAIGRGLSAEEKAQGLQQSPISREKIAIVVSAQNPFTGSFKDEQFAAMFRGEITDWQEVGGSRGTIRFIDRPESSDTRQALRNYPVFQAAPFRSGPKVVRLSQDSTADLVKQLGPDGIGYAIASQVINQPGIRIVRMHNTLPDDPRYPFSQPRVYVFKGSLKPAAQEYLGFASTAQGQAAVQAAKQTEAASVTAGSATPMEPTAAAVAPDATPAADAQKDRIPGWLPLLLLALLAPLLWWWKNRQGAVTEGAVPAAAPIPPTTATTPTPVPPTPVSPTPVSPAPEPTAVVPEPVPPPVAEPAPPAPTPIVPSVATPAEATAPVDMTKLAGAAAVAAAGVAVWSAVTSDDRAQTDVEAAKYDVGQDDRTGGDLASVDAGLADLPDGYGESRITLLPRDPQWAYAYWDAPNEQREAVRRQGGSRLALRFYDVTDVDLNTQRPHSVQQYECDELARDWYLPVPVSDRDYLVELGYLTDDGRWLMLARSNQIRIPPTYPSDWFEDQFLNISWDEDLRGKTFATLTPPDRRQAGSSPVSDQIFAMAQSAEAQRLAGSLFGSMQHVAGSLFGSAQMVPSQAISSYVFPSGVGMWASGAGLWASGAGMSGVGFSASAPPIRSRKFWLVADAELIIYGATEPDATVTIGGRPVQLNPDGTFRFQMSFQDGQLDFPILAVAVDGVQTRAIHLKFNRETPIRRTNTKEEATDEWQP